MVVEGLEGVVAAESEMSFIDGEEGKLVYKGYNIHDLAQNVEFEELFHLFWDDDLPNQEELDETRETLRKHRSVDDNILDLI
ncbi:MAG: citrate/2-methylcitrate synthase, partial [bacterium]